MFDVRQIADLGERLRSDHCTDGHRVGGVQHLPGFIRREERVHQVGGRDVDGFDGVGEDETVHADHHRQRQLFGDTERLHMQRSPVGSITVAVSAPNSAAG